MEHFCTITPSRGDRPELLEFCKRQIDRMTVKPNRSYFITYPPVSKHPDLVPRIREGIRRAQEDGIDKVFILEDDDFFAPDYFEHFNFSGKTDFVGSTKTVYYSLRHQKYTELHHRGRSSLFCTGFRISALSGFKWPDNNYVFLDLPLWTYAAKKKHIKFVEQDVRLYAMGMKHGLGLCGGKGHSMLHENWDDRLEYLSRVTDSEAFKFYVGLMQKNGWI